MSLSLRLYIAEITRYAGPMQHHAQVKLLPAYKNGANASWSAATPAGEILLTVTNPDAIAQLEDWMRLGVDVAGLLSAVDPDPVSAE